VQIRRAQYYDIDHIMDIYDLAKQYMRANGNWAQWVNGYPNKDLLIQDIEKERCYVCEINDTLEAVFVFIYGEDETYEKIENGNWLNNNKYATIHRIASSGRVKGIANACFDWCKNQHNNLRADTHADNKIMQHVLEKNSFIECGTIYVQDGTPRIAYQFSG